MNSLAKSRWFLFLAIFSTFQSTISHYCWTDVKTAVSKSRSTSYAQSASCAYNCNWRTQYKTVSTTCYQNECYLDYEVTRKQVCCDGYHEVNGECMAVCSKGCDNGRCTAPDVCSCNKGYLMVNGRCVAQCSSCNNGNCVAPNQCVCAAGFVKNNAGLCVPKCKDDCVNGICNELNQCVCKDGYFFNEKLLDFGITNNTVCTAKCDRPCRNGVCTGRNKCECLFGYELSQYDQFTCNPVCDPTWMNCSYGQCVAPNKCICHFGYKRDWNKCVPACDPECENGNCDNPGECSCWNGYEKSDESHKCIPSCNPPCENGACVGVNQCSCLNGYQQVNSSYCEPTCDSRFVNVTNGSCIAPNVLRCDAGFTLHVDDNSKLSCELKCHPKCINATCSINGSCQCLEGYQLVAGSSHECEPVCVPPCQNGHCIAPNSCACDHGYRKTQVNSNTCSFYCNPDVVDCMLGTCTDVDTCDCPDGFELKEGEDAILRCTPVCSLPCINGHCVDTNECDCLLGFSKVNSSYCEPRCDQPCINGICIEPNVCNCSEGYLKINDNDCEPHCDPDFINCSHGSCIGPNKCSCHDGYELFVQDSDSITKCNPVCENLLENTICAAPGEVRCVDGHEMTDDGSCGPVCYHDCGEGVCIAPDECRCNPGYAVFDDPWCVSICENNCTAEQGNCSDLHCVCNEGYANLESPFFCLPICKGCGNGNCVAPDECECNDGYEPSNVTMNCDPVCSNCTQDCCIAPEICSCERSEKVSTSNGTSTSNLLIIALILAAIFSIAATTILIYKYIINKKFSRSYKCQYNPSTEQASIGSATQIVS